MTLDPIAVGTASMEELQFAEGLDAWEVNHRPDALRHKERAPYGTRWLDYYKGDASKLEYRSRSVVQKIHQDDVAAITSAAPLLEVVRICCGFANVDAWCRATIAECLASTPSETTCTSKPRKNLAGTRHSACDSRDAGMGHVTQDEPSSLLCATT